MLRVVVGQEWAGWRPGGSRDTHEDLPGYRLSRALIAEVCDSGRRHPRGAVAFVATVLGIMLAWLLIGRDGWRDSFAVHGRRGLEVEAVACGIALILHRILGFNILIIDNFGSSNLYFKHYDLLVSAIPGLQLATVISSVGDSASRGGDRMRLTLAAALGRVHSGEGLAVPST